MRKKFQNWYDRKESFDKVLFWVFWSAMIIAIPAWAAVAVMNAFSSNNGGPELKVVKKTCAAVPNGGTVAIIGSGFTPNGPVVVTAWHNGQRYRPYDRKVRASAAGEPFWTVPCNTTLAGRLGFTATDRDMGKQASASYTVERKLH